MVIAVLYMTAALTSEVHQIATEWGRVKLLTSRLDWLISQAIYPGPKV